jgi:hypothetical protein
MTKAKQTEIKPLFVPLAHEHFEAFRRGNKRREFRLYNDRWNERTCKPGREVILSDGYGKWRRMKGKIEAFDVTMFGTLDSGDLGRSLRACFLNKRGTATRLKSGTKIAMIGISTNRRVIKGVNAKHENSGLMVPSRSGLTYKTTVIKGVVHREAVLLKHKRVPSAPMSRKTRRLVLSITRLRDLIERAAQKRTGLELTAAQTQVLKENLMLRTY